MKKEHLLVSCTVRRQYPLDAVPWRLQLVLQFVTLAGITSTASIVVTVPWLCLHAGLTLVCSLQLLASLVLSWRSLAWWREHSR